MIRGGAKPYAARVKDGSNTITTAVSQKIFIQKVIVALVCIALDFTAPSLLTVISYKEGQGRPQEFSQHDEIIGPNYSNYIYKNTL